MIRLMLCIIGKDTTEVMCPSQSIIPENTQGWSIITGDVWVSQVALVVKNSRANAGDVKEVTSFPGLKRSPGEGNGNLFQYSCLENPMDRGPCRATVCRVAQSQT